MLLEDVALLFQAGSRGVAAIRQLSQILQLIGIFLLMNIYIHISLFGDFKRIVEFETIAASYCKTSNELIQVG